MGKLFRESILPIIRTLHRERVFALAIFVAVLISLGALGYYITEPYKDLPPPADTRTPLQHLGQALWWAIVTVTTVGYGDITPKTPAGRVWGGFLMIGGLVSLSLVTATVASIFIDRKIRRERGLETIKTVNHILILGWHNDGENLLTQLLRRLPPTVPVVLVNELPMERMDAIRAKYAPNEPKFVFGDYSREEILHKANVNRASRAIILAYRRDEETSTEVDQRTLLTALTLKSLNPKIRIMVELLRSENQPYVERAGAEEVLIRGQYDSSLLAGLITSRGLYRVLSALINAEGFTLWSVDIPSRYQGRPVKELADYLRESQQALVIALVNEGRALSLEDLLSDEPSAIDDFIRTKFAETGMSYLFGRSKVDFQINPPDTQLLGPHQKAVVIAAKPPEI